MPVKSTLGLWAQGSISARFPGPGTGLLSLVIDEVRLPGISPSSLEELLECLMRMVLSAMIQNLSLPLQALNIGSSSLVVEQGPEINDDILQIWGRVV
jgi:hypothetical protein